MNAGIAAVLTESPNSQFVAATRAPRCLRRELIAGELMSLANEERLLSALPSPQRFGSSDTTHGFGENAQAGALRDRAGRREPTT